MLCDLLGSVRVDVLRGGAVRGQKYAVALQPMLQGRQQ